ncbi:R2 Retrovirus-related Pol polyprotein from type I retrotransposable element [Takifugu flavidus]|uniref:R2 Retrovirus-related Pol polyprotein from type I retrotransposable element n=1 Tax=Takifugu flavidus TaxID=433684 RepID=A0A5C6NVF8_9TELE|nr:R2 Retrovirus-related Pol polyprotein from type I retrotransposable element [Takifugu flavidus]
MDSDLEVLIRIPATSHSVANRPSICWRSLFDGARRTTSSAKSSDEIFRPLNSTPSTPRLRLEILSIKVMNRTGDKGQPWRSPTLTGNESDLQPAIRTKLLLFDTSGMDPTRLCMQEDCNLVMYNDEDKPRWHTNSAKGSCNTCVLSLTNEGKLVLEKDGQEIWNSDRDHGMK